MTSSRLRLVLIPIAVLAAFTQISWVRANPHLSGSIYGAVAALLVLLLLLSRQVRNACRKLSYQFVPRPVHYVQLVMHTSIYVYWGWYWREVYHYAPLILAQIAFVYALDMLVSWFRRDVWVFGFGPFPIVLSTNLFLWFKDDWFYLQFLLIATGVLCKEFVTWTRDGRRTHIFNPSAISLAIFSAGLLLTGSTRITWGEEVAVSLGRPPHIYLEIFALGLIVQALFSVTLVTLSAAAVLVLANLWYTGLTGVYQFVDSTIPIAVFLGLHLLVTDPATSPRRNAGKVLFGGMYGAGVFGMYSILGWFGMPTFYDKLLCVPPLNLLVQPIDWAAAVLEGWVRRLRVPRAAWGSANSAHMSGWIALFAVLFSTGFVGGRHPGSNPEFWRQACAENRHQACQTWVRVMNVNCQHGSGSACLTLGAVWSSGEVVMRDLSEAGKDFGRACDLGAPGGCPKLVGLVSAEGQGVFQPACERGDGESCFLLGSLFYAGRGVPKDFGRAAELFRQACGDGWSRGCGGLAECYRAGQGIAPDSAQAIQHFEKACRDGVAASCFSVATMYRALKDEPLARERFQQACEVSTRYAIQNAAYFRPGAGASAAPLFCTQANR